MRAVLGTQDPKARRMAEALGADPDTVRQITLTRGVGTSMWGEIQFFSREGFGYDTIALTKEQVEILRRLGVIMEAEKHAERERIGPLTDGHRVAELVEFTAGLIEHVLDRRATKPPVHDLLDECPVEWRTALGLDPERDWPTVEWKEHVMAGFCTAHNFTTFCEDQAGHKGMHWVRLHMSNGKSRRKFF